MATINGVYHPTDSDPYLLTGAVAGAGDLGLLAASAATKAADAAAAAAASALEDALEEIAATRWYQGQMPSGTNLNTVTGTTGSSGIWRAIGSEMTNAPPAVSSQGIFTSIRITTAVGQQRWLTPPGTEYLRTQDGGTWTDWERVDRAGIIEGAAHFIPSIEPGTDLDTLTGTTSGTGKWRAVASQVTNAPPGLSAAGILRAYRFNSASGVQEWMTNLGNVWKRSQFSGPWSPWEIVRGGEQEVRIFHTLQEAQEYEANNPGTGLFLG